MAIDNFLLALFISAVIGGVIGVTMYRVITRMREALSYNEVLKLNRYRRSFSFQDITRDGKPVVLTPREELGMYQLIDELNPQIDKLTKEKGLEGKKIELVLDIRSGKLKGFDVKVTPNTTNQSSEVPLSVGVEVSEDFEQIKNEDKDSRPSNGWYMPCQVKPPKSQGDVCPGVVTPEQVSIYSADVNRGLELTKNIIEKHYKGKGLIRPSRSSQRDYRSRF